jgi:menaquinone-specific isochorismate synthase
MPFESQVTLNSITEQYGRLVSYSQFCPGISLATFLQHARGQERFYWESSCDHVAFAGFGTAIELRAWGADRFKVIHRSARELFGNAVVLDETQPLAAPRLFGGFAFSDDFMPDYAWSTFSPAHFVLPHYQLVRFGDEVWLTINAHIPANEVPTSILAELREALNARLDLLRSVKTAPTWANNSSDILYPMPYETWEELINTATQQMRSGVLDKVVLSRVCEIRFDQPVDVDAALSYLSQQYADCYRFLFEPRPHHAFFGATPELLVRVENQSVTTMALAGSIKRGKSLQEDHTLADQLLNDPKERYEHQVVVETLKEKLQPITDNLHVPGTPSVYKLSNIQHLFTPIEGRLHQPTGVIPIVELLHPTPALGGSPRQSAMEFIRSAEPVPRGWYAAPVGWIDRSLNGQFGVAIRSAVTQEKRVWMYAGAGIVADSVPYKEWEETALKFCPMLDALGIKDQVNV